jgi:hypothetical protein
MDFAEQPSEEPPELPELCIRLKSISDLPPKVEASDVALEIIVGDMRLWVSPESKVAQGTVSWRSPDMKYPQYNFSLPPGRFPCASKKIFTLF